MRSGPFRDPRERMPAFPARVVSREEARSIFEFVRSVPPPPTRLGPEPPLGVQDSTSCATCHRDLHPTVVRQFEASAMGRPGTQNGRVDYAVRELNCAHCHGTDHDRIMASKKKRNRMIRVCMTCHSEDKARGYLKSADAHKLAGDALVVEAREILDGLYEDGLIDPSHGQRAAGLLEGPRFTATELPTDFAQHWPAGLYYNVSAIEREYFDMFFFSNLKSYKGAFHMSPDYAWWYGYADVLGHLRIPTDSGR